MSVSNFWELIFLLTIGQGLFQVILLLTSNRGNVLANKLLALLVFIFTYKLLYLELLWTGLIRYTAGLTLSYEPLDLLMAPLFYLYIKQLTGRALRKSDLWHMIPFVVCLGYMFPLFFSDLQTKIQFVTNWRDYPVFEINLLPYFRFMRRIQLILYAIWVYKMLRDSEYKASIPVNMAWLKSLEKAWIVYAFITIMAYVLGRYVQLSIPEYWYPFTLSVAIYTLGYLGYGIHGVPVPGFLKPKYQTGLNKEQSQDYYDELVALMEDQQLYLQNNLKLSDIAKYLGISQNYVSQIVNEHSGYNFPEFVNRYRVRAAQEMLSNPKTWGAKMLAVAYDSGFNNKVSFYKSFKKFVGASPLEFKRVAEANLEVVGV